VRRQRVVHVSPERSTTATTPCSLLSAGRSFFRLSRVTATGAAAAEWLAGTGAAERSAETAACRASSVAALARSSTVPIQSCPEPGPPAFLSRKESTHAIAASRRV